MKQLLIMPINIFIDLRNKEGGFILFLIDGSSAKKARALFTLEYYYKYGLRFDLFWMGLATELKTKKQST
jgi:hypothetical protein